MPSSPATSVWLDNANKYQESWRNPNRSSQAATSETESVIESDYSEESVDSHPSVSSATLSFVYSEGGTRQEVGNEVLLSDCRVGYFYYLKHGDSAAILEMAQQCKVDAGQLGHPVLVVGFLSDGRIVCHPTTSLQGKTPREKYPDRSSNWSNLLPVAPKPRNEDSVVEPLKFAGCPMRGGTYIRFAKTLEVFPSLLTTIGRSKVGEYRLALESINRLRQRRGELPLSEDPHYERSSSQAKSWRSSSATGAAANMDKTAFQAKGDAATRPRRDISACSSWRSSLPSTRSASPPAMGSFSYSGSAPSETRTYASFFK